jgi:hypothetical protein
MPRKTTTVICQRCGGAFETASHRLARGRGKYCSRACASAAQSRVLRICVHCGEEFTVWPSQVKYGGGRRCSWNCRSYRVERTCATCGQTFSIKRVEARRRGGKYCSLACLRVPVEQRFWRKVVQTACCWLWVGKSRTRTGYGKIDVGGRDGGHTVFAHRVAYEIAHGPIPGGMVVRHICDVKLCVRPDHLILGTNRDNHADYMTRGRHQPGCCAPAITWL